MKKLFCLIFVFICACMFIGCSNNDEKIDDKKEENEPTYFISQTTISNTIGDTVKLSIQSSKVINEKIEWTSSDEKVAAVSQDGLVESYGVGKADITAKIGETELKCAIAVSLGNSIPVLIVENIESSFVIGVSNEVFPFNCYVLFNGKKYYDADVEYSSSNSSVADFDKTNKSSLLIKQIGKCEISFSAVWRNVSVVDCPSLSNSLSLNIVEDVYYRVNGSQLFNIDLYTLDSYDGINYKTEIDFKPTLQIGKTIIDDIIVEYDDTKLIYQDQKMIAKSYGESVITLKYVDNDNEYINNIAVNVIRPQKNVSYDYFSAFTGTFKDKNNGYVNSTIINNLFKTNEVENLVVKCGNYELQVEDGKILGIEAQKGNTCIKDITIETDKIKINAQLTVYDLVIYDKDDLLNFSLKVTKEDDVSTENVNEAEYTCIKGYCELLRNIDAENLKIQHPLLTLLGNKLDSANIEKPFGFCGLFNGNGYTISNLDTSVSEGEIGGGLFGYCLGSAVIQDLGLKNVKMSNSSALMYLSCPRGFNSSFGIQNNGETTIKDIYISIDSTTVNPNGAIFSKPVDPWMGLYNIENVLIDATGVRVSSENAGGVFSFSTAASYSAYGQRKNIYVVSSYPVAFSSSTKITGENLVPDGIQLDNLDNSAVRFTLLPAVIYASGIKHYTSMSNLLRDEQNDFSSFGSCWNTNGELSFKSAEVFQFMLDSSVQSEKTVVLNSIEKSYKLGLYNKISESDVNNIVFVNNNTDKFTIDENNNISLVNNVSKVEEYIITATVQNETVEIKVVLSPAEVHVDTLLKISALNDNFDYTKYISKEYVFNNNQLISATQEVLGESNSLLISDNLIKDLKVVVKSDKTNVETSKIIILTKFFDVIFDNVLIYSKVIESADDMQVFAHTSNESKLTGYYILSNNIDMNCSGIVHDVSIYNSNIDETSNSFQGIFDGQGYYIKNFKPNIGGLFGKVFSDSEANGGCSIIRNVGFINVKSERSDANGSNDFAILGKYIINSNDAVTQITNVHVQIDETYLSSYLPVSNYKGLFYSNSLTKLNTFKMTNIYIEITNEEFMEGVNQSSGTILSVDTQIINSTLEERSKRFENVVTVSKNRPCVCRKWVNDGFTTEFGVNMYYVYAENEVGTKGLILNGNYPHDSVCENSSKGCYIYNNVFRYENSDDVDTLLLNKLVSTKLWIIRDGKLYWKSQPYDVNIEFVDNFDIDWLDAKKVESVDKDSIINFDIDWLNAD